MAAQLKKKLLQTHKDLIDAVFHRGEDPRSRLLDLMSPDLHGCGTARHEAIQNIDDYLAIFDGEVNELPVGLKDKPINLRTTIIGNVAIVHGAYELHFKIENDNALMYVRLTVVYEYTNKKWQAVHLHGSEPSAHIAEGETWPVEALKAQNEELKKTVAEKTADLEQKNNNLLVEVALEKVRSRTMAMQNSSELAETTEVLHQQLIELGIKADRTSIAFPDETSGTAEFWSTDLGGTKIDHKFIGDLAEPHHGIKTFAGWKKKLKSIVIQLEGEQLSALLNYYKEKVGLPFSGQIPKTTKRDYTSAYFSHGWITLATAEPLSNEKINTLERFAAVFSLTYTRFLDLQKAEAQTREAKIEAALERVRLSAMAMQTSADVGEATSAMFVELDALGIETFRCGIAIVKDEELEVWSVGNTGDGRTVKGVGRVGINLHPLWQLFKKSWMGKEAFLYHYLQGQEKEDYIKVLTTTVGYSLSGTNLHFPNMHFQSYYFEEGGVFTFSLHQHNEFDKQVMMRFTKVFSLTFRRYLDLQKAEGQTRESQIELGLERVRARAMGMQNSDELKELISTVFAELTKLDLALTRCLIMIYDPKTNGSTWWMANSEAPSDSIGLFVQYHEQPPYLAYIKAWQQRNLKWQYILEGTVKKQWDDFLFIETELSDLPDFIIAGMKAPARVYLNASFNNFGNLTLASLEPLSNEHFDILLRFAKVFDLTYTRFNDLKQAEAQTREARIEAALEKVRSRSLAMHHSDELKEVITVVLKKLQELGIEMDKRSAGIFIFEKGSKDYIQWVASPEHASSVSFRTPYFDHPIQTDLWNEREMGNNFFEKAYSLQEKNSLFQHFFGHTDLRHLPKEEKNWILDNEHYALAVAFEKNSALAVATFSGILLTVSESEILKRFASVFEQAYTRFLDLQKAEAQAKGAKIEASLERVRTQTAVMNKSSELGQTASVIFSELDKLELQTLRCGIGIFNKSDGSADIWTTTKTQDGYTLNIAGNQPMDWHPVLQGTKDAFDSQEDFSYILQGEDLDRYYKAMGSTSSYKLPESTAGLVHPNDATHYYYCTFFHSGGLYFFREKPFTEEIIKVIRRFANAFSLAYKRFEDLKQSEARTLDAIKASSLDRVRAEIASMRSTEDLERITPLIWNELTTLGVPFIRCGVFIMDEDNKQIHTFLSTPDGKAIAAFKLPFTAPGTPAQALAHWRNKEIFKDHWDGDAFSEWTKNLVAQGAIASSEKYSTEHPPTNLDLYFLPFLQGMLYVGNEAPLSDEEINLVQTLANAFSTAYARYEDFNKLESAKQQIEKTLVDLKLAQSQLIQSEKMASLGELTAGIAHEIQNPLNFINNFSEVNTELLDEMEQEIANDNLEGVRSIATDIKQNEQKISHHGKRADFIVKGMLQHSRTSTGEKQATNINTLADEFLKLSYHGLRAKDKSFNSELITNFDENLPKINVVQQDIGRVLLNLFNNAFYAVNERKKSKEQGAKSKEEYKPTVEVSTSSKEGFVTITVKDNGTGIPEAIKEKIMQPFFTTKPTGEGTGLGLSLSYDIVKAHGGELTVETRDGEGSIFIIKLPA